MVDLLTIMLHGVLIGVLVSAPMGPIGILVIQRTLTKGRWPAFYTGLGASLSDMTYCLLTGLGLSFVTDFIEGNKDVLQLVGSGMLAVYALYLFFHNPSRQLMDTRIQATSYWRDFATGFLFTFANPLILFFIIGLFARFNFMDSGYMTLHYIAGYVCIAAGALLWWFVVTLFVDKVRGHFNVRSMWIVNRVIASLLVLMAVVGVVTGIKALI